MAKKPRVWTPPKTSLRALQEMKFRHSMEYQQLLQEVMLDSRDKNDRLMPTDIVEGNVPIEFNGASFSEPQEQAVVEGEK